MAALLDDPPAVEHDDAVARDRLAEPVGDDDGGATADRAGGGPVEQGGVAGIGFGGGLIEDRQTRVVQQHAREREVLGIRGADRVPMPADDRVQAIGCGVQQPSGEHVLQSFDEFRVGRVGARESEVVSESTGEDVVLLAEVGDSRMSLEERATMSPVPTRSTVAGGRCRARETKLSRRVAIIVSTTRARATTPAKSNTPASSTAAASSANCHQNTSGIPLPVRVLTVSTIHPTVSGKTRLRPAAAASSMAVPDSAHRCPLLSSRRAASICGTDATGRRAPSVVLMACRLREGMRRAARAMILSSTGAPMVTPTPRTGWIA